jgi:PST family polysaccharide transporter
MNDGDATQAAAPAPQQSLTAAAAKGSAWATAQGLVNKAVTAAAMFLIARLLSKEQYGVATQALAVGQFLVVMTPLSMGDVLIAHPRRFAALAPTARRVTILVALATAAIVFCSLPVVVQVYSTYPAAWLAGLLAVLALRPLVEAFIVVPLSAMRLGLHYRAIALIDGGVQLVATCVTVAMAALGAGGASLVVPLVAGTAARAALYRRSAEMPRRRRFHRAAAAVLLRAYFAVASAQYVHNLLVMLEVLVLGYVSGEEQVGVFGFAFMLATQANAIISVQLSTVLQPIFGRLQHDPVRQTAGFVRAVRVLGAVIVPVSLVQAVVAAPLFRIAFPAQWEPAVPVFAVLSVMQAFYFGNGPTMSLLKAQRRFRLYFAWQFSQLVVAVPAYWFGAREGGALGVALASMSVWATGVPIAVWLGIRAGGGTLRDAFLIYARPWASAVPVCAAAWFGARWLAQFGLVGDVASIVLLAPVALAGCLWATRFVDREASAEVGRGLQSVLGRIRRK